MKNMLAPKTLCGVLAAAAFAALAVGSVGSSVNAADLWWDNNGGTANSWSDVNNWSTTVGGGSTPGAIPGSSDVARFSATPIVGTAQTVNLNGNQSVLGIAVAAVTQPVTLRGGGANRTLTIGSSGVTSASTADIVIGSFDANQNVNVLFSGNQSLTNNGTARLDFLGATSGSGSPTLTNNGAGTGAVAFRGSDGINNTVNKIIQDSATSDLWLRDGYGTASAFSGGVEVRRGVLFFGNANSNLGTGTLTLGVNGGTAAVTARAQENVNATFANPILLATGHTGTITIEMTEDQVGVSHSKTFTGGITGTNSFTIRNNGGDDNLNFNTGSINNIGTITHAGTATTGVTTISAVIGSNVTGLTQSGSATLVLNAANTHGGTTTVSGGTLRLGNVNALQNSTLNTGTSGGQQVTFTVAGTNTYNIGGLSGADALAIGGNTLRVGANNQNTTYSGAISGAAGGFTKQGSGISTLSGTSSYTGATTVSAGQLAVDGDIATSSGVSVSSGATLGGSGRVSAISGAGTVAPGNSPGILRATAANISTGMDFKFEFTQAGAPTWSSATASGNDVLRLTDAATPISGSATAANVFDIYFPTITAETTFLGGLFTDRNASFESLISAATYNYYTRDPSGPVSYGGFQYSALASADVTRTTVQVASANFSGGTVANGYTMQFVVVPEPAGIALAGIGVAAAALGRRLCRRERPTSAARS